MKGLCGCGCGASTVIASRNRRQRGWIKGQPVSYVWGHNPTIPFLQRIVRFWSMARLLPTSGWPDCIEWGNYTRRNGYGMYSAGILGETAAHRIAYILTFGPIPVGLEPDHLCRNRGCINPLHLEAVTRKVNARRGAKAKLTIALVAEIRASRESDRVWARRLGISRGAVNHARSGRTWSD